jgi:hypothetical protein
MANDTTACGQIITASDFLLELRNVKTPENFYAEVGRIKMAAHSAKYDPVELMEVKKKNGHSDEPINGRAEEALPGQANCSRSGSHRVQVSTEGPRQKEAITMLFIILVVVLILALVAAVPVWPHSRGWGYFPSGLIGLVILILLALSLSGRL